MRTEKEKLLKENEELKKAVHLLEEQTAQTTSAIQKLQNLQSKGTI